MSVVQRKNVEAIALDQNIAPRTLQRLLDSIVWDYHKLCDMCQQIVATEHAHPEAAGRVVVFGTEIQRASRHTVVPGRGVGK